jgi:L-ribulose-5-phosphate 3-epimerase
LIIFGLILLIKPTKLDRRIFVKQAAGIIGATNFITLSEAFGKTSPNLRPNTPTLCIFSKHLQWLDYGEMAIFAKNIGFRGIDLTVRPGGHVLPENVEKDLPRAVSAIQAQGLTVPMITTSITNSDDPTTHSILKTASGLGVKVYRMGWWRYEKGRSVKAQLAEKGKEMHKLNALNTKYKIKGSYQNHAGNYVGAAGWDLAEILKGIDPAWTGVQYDIRHATVEGHYSWPFTFELLAPYINSLDIKDFGWFQTNSEWKLVNLPLGKGMVNFNQYFEMVKRHSLTCDYSIHYEYDLGGAEHGRKPVGITMDALAEAMKNDLGFVRGKLA